MFRPRPLKDKSSRKNGLLNSLTTEKMALSGRSLPALPAKSGGTNQYLQNDAIDPFVIMKYENLKARTQASQVTGAKGGRALIESLQERSSLRMQGTTVQSIHSSLNDIPTMMTARPSQRNAESKESRGQSPPKKPTKLPSLVMMPSMVIGDVKQIRKLRRPSQVDDVRNVKLQNLIELRPLADEKDEKVSPALECDTEHAAKRPLARSLWFPVDEQNTNRVHPFMEKAKDSSGSFEKRLHARINSYIRNNNSPGCIRTTLDFTKSELPNPYSQPLSEDTANLHFHFSQLELEVGKSLKKDGVSPTPLDLRITTKYDVTDPALRHSPILLRKGLRDALKLPPEGCPRASMRSEVVQAEGLKHPLKTLKLRNDYAKNLERNWMRRHKTEQRQKRREREIRITVGTWINERVNMATQDFSRAFYSSDDVTDDEDGMVTGIDDVIMGKESKAVSKEVSFGDSPSPTRWSTVTTGDTNFRNCSSYHPGFTTPQHVSSGDYITDRSELQGWNSQEFINKATEGFENQPSTLHHRRGYHEDAFSEASMEVQYSDMDQNADIEQTIEIVLKDGQLYDRYVKKKKKRQHRRMRKRFETLVFPESSDEEETEKEEQEICRMTDTELRALRLKLNKEEEEDIDPTYTRDITSALLRDLSRLTSSTSKKKKKKKKKKKTPKQAPLDTMTVRERFLKDFGWLLDTKIKSRLLANKSIISANSSQMGDSVNGETETTEQLENNTFASFLKTINEDVETLRSLDPEAIGFKKKIKKEKQKVLRRKKEFQKIYDEKIAAIRAEREKKLQENGGETEEVNEETGNDAEPEKINPEEWEYVTESDEDESKADDDIQKRARRNSFGGRTKPDKLAYEKLIEKPIPIKPKSSLKSGKSSRTVSKIGSPVKRSTPAARCQTGSEKSIQLGSISIETDLPEEQRNVVGTSPSLESLHKQKSLENERVKLLRNESANEAINQNLETTSDPDLYNSEQPVDDGESVSETDDHFPKPRDGYYFDTEIAEIDTRCLRRTQSWRRLHWNEEEISLHDLLDGIDLPAKEIKIQIVSRRRKRQREKMQKQLQYQGEMRAKNHTEVATNETEHKENCDGTVAEYDTSDNESTATTCRLSFSEDAPFLSAYLQWNRENRYKSEFTDEQLDEEIEDLGDLFWQMKDCRYIRWGKRDQAIITRLFELDLFDR